MNWRLVETKLSWGVLFLIGGGFALAEGFSVSGLSDYIGSKVKSFIKVFELLVLGFMTLLLTL